MEQQYEKANKGLQFNSRTTVLRGKDLFIAKKDIGADIVNILLPVLVYKVVVPDITPRELNAFQEVILKILCHGNVDKKELSEHLLLAEDLVGYILGELQGKKYFVNNEVTEMGKAALDGELEPDKTITGYVFYNALNGKLYDAFVPEEDFTDMVMDSYSEKDGKRDVFKGYSRKPDRCTVIHCNENINTYPIELDKYEIYRALKNYLQNMYVINKGSLYAAELETYNISVDGIYCISTPEPYYLADIVYYNSDPINKGVQVLNPFYGYDDIKQLEILQELANIDDETDKILNSLRNSTSIIYSKHRRDASATIIEHAFKISNHTGVFKYIVQALSEVVESYDKLIDAHIGSADLKNSATESFVRDVYASIEYMLYYCLKDEEINISRIRGGRNYAEVLQEMAHKIGFDCEASITRQMFSKISIAGLQDVKNAKEMKHLLAANLLTAIEKRDYIFNKIAERYENFITDIAYLKILRDATSHDGYERIEFDNIKGYFIFSFQIARYVFGLNSLNETYINNYYLDKTSKLYGWDIAKDTEESVYEICQRRADTMVQDTFGMYILGPEFTTVYHYLVDLHTAQVMHSSVDVYSARVLEALIGLVFDKVGIESYYSEFTKRIAGTETTHKILAALNKYGFDEMKDALPQYLYDRWSKPDYAGGLNKLNKVFSDKIYLMWLYIVFIEKDKAKALSKEKKDIWIIMLKYGLRKHNNWESDIAIDYNENQHIIDEVVECSKAVFKVFMEVHNGKQG